MNFLSRITGGPAKVEAAESIRASEKKQEMAIRTKPYSGLEIKTLWNHFNKDDLLTVGELADLLDRIVAKDAADIYASIKKSKSWKEYCLAVLGVMDTSKGSTIDLAEFNGEFNTFYTARADYALKFLVPALLAELKCEELPVGNAGADKKLQAQVDKLKTALEESKAELLALRTENSDLKLAKTDLEEENANLLSAQKNSTEIQTLRDSLQKAEAERHRLETENERLRKSENDVKSQIDAVRSESARKASDLEAEFLQLMADAEKRGKSLESQLSALKEENDKLKKARIEGIAEWRDKFSQVLNENEECRQLLSEMKEELTRANAAILAANAKESPHNGLEGISAFHAAGISEVALDPFRTELVNQFGSVDAVIGKRKRLTLHEMESIATSMGYSREYSRKLFYALDVKNRGFVTGDQFARPLPLLNKELVLLTKPSPSS